MKILYRVSGANSVIGLTVSGGESHREIDAITATRDLKSVDRTFAEIRSLAGVGSRVVFDYVSASVIRGEKDGFGGAEASKAVSGAGESWHFGIERGDPAGFLAKFGMTLADEKNAEALERTYLRKSTGEIAGRVNAAHAIVTAEILT